MPSIFARALLGLVGRLDDLDAAALAAAAGVDLRLDDDDAAAEPCARQRRLRRRVNDDFPCGTGTPCGARMALA